MISCVRLLIFSFLFSTINASESKTEVVNARRTVIKYYTHNPYADALRDTYDTSLRMQRAGISDIIVAHRPVLATTTEQTTAASGPSIGRDTTDFNDRTTDIRLGPYVTPVASGQTPRRQKPEIGTHFKTREEHKQAILSQISTLNNFNESGQTMAHQLTPVNWMDDVIALFIHSGGNVTIQSKHPDKHPGSTLAHNVAGFLCARRNESTPEHLQLVISGLRCLLQLWAVDNGAHFNTKALSNSNATVSVWSLLHKSDLLYTFLPMLPNKDNVPLQYKPQGCQPAIQGKPL